VECEGAANEEVVNNAFLYRTKKEKNLKNPPVKSYLNFFMCSFKICCCSTTLPPDFKLVLVAEWCYLISYLKVGTNEK
jgi:hypothetical protein